MNQRQTISSLSSVAETRPRPLRFRYRHSIVLAARALGIPVSWAWFWAYTGRFQVKKWTGAYYVRLEDVSKALCDSVAVEAAFEATGDPIRSQATGELLLSQWPRMPQEISQPEVQDSGPSTSQGQPEEAEPQLELVGASEQ